MVPALRDGYGNPSGATRWRARPAPRSTRRAPSWPRSSAASPASSCSPAAAPRPTTWPCAACSAPGAARSCATAIEHHAVLHPVRGGGGRLVGVDARGRRRPRRARRPRSTTTVTLVSVVLVNNEVGTIQPLAQIAEVVRAQRPAARAPHRRRPGADAGSTCASAAAPADLVTLASHKCGGPVGTGALVVRGGVALQAQQLGGGQERERRSGTQDVAGAVGFAAAAIGGRRRADALCGASRRVARRPRRRRAEPVSRARSRARSPAAPTADHLVAGHRQRVPARGRQRGAALPPRARAPRCWPAPRRAARAAPRSRRTCWRRSGVDRQLGGRFAAALARVVHHPGRRRCRASHGVPEAARRLQAHARDGAPA